MVVGSRWGNWWCGCWRQHKAPRCRYGARAVWSKPHGDNWSVRRSGKWSQLIAGRHAGGYFDPAIALMAASSGGEHRSNVRWSVAHRDRRKSLQCEPRDSGEDVCEFADPDGPACTAFRRDAFRPDYTGSHGRY